MQVEKYAKFENLKRGYLFAKLLNDDVNKKASKLYVPIEEKLHQKAITEEEAINLFVEIDKKLKTTETLELMLTARRALIKEAARITQEKATPEQWEQIKEVFKCTLPSIREKLIESMLHFDPSL